MKEQENSTMGKSNRKIWIFTICFAVLANITAISCVMVYLIDQKLMNDLSGARNDMNKDKTSTDKPAGEESVIGAEHFLRCQPFSCDPMCIEEWYEGNFTCELGFDVGPVDYNQQRPTKANHKPRLLPPRKLLQVASLTNIDRFWRDELEPLLIPRVSDTEGIRAARRHIIQRLDSLGGWQIEQNSFDDNTPFGVKNFVNIIATLNPLVERRLVLACHYDSKYFAPRPNDGREFIGATDSAVPCAMLLDLAYSLNEILKANPLEMVTIQLMFFDGEEAFVQWTETDSLYGSRYLANQLYNTRYGSGTELDRIDMLVLLDLIGERNPKFHNHFPATSKWFQHMQKVENRLKSNNQLQSHYSNYFTTGRSYGGIEDDHIPFLRRDVACFHIIATPFPEAWHKMSDVEKNLDKDTIHNLNRMLQVFTAEYLHLKLPSV